MQIMTVVHVEHIAFKLAKEFLTYDEPIPDFTTRYPRVLESCLQTPFQTFDKKELYPTLIGKTSILFYLMIKNHPFQNGNKRIAMTTLFCFLYMNNKWLEVNNEVLYRFAVWVTESPADAKDMVIDYIKAFLRKYIIGRNK